jgi:hypothetical protein
VIALPIVVDVPVVIASATYTTYTSVKQHRGRVNSDKSRWIIPMDEELECFELTYFKKWHRNSIGWGLHILENRITVLGKNPEGEQLKLAKFVDSSKNNKWHGYPADYRCKIQDRPPQDILEKWRSEGLIKKHQIMKIRRGMACNL